MKISKPRIRPAALPTDPAPPAAAAAAAPAPAAPAARPGGWVARNAAAVAKFVALKGTEALAPARFQQEDDRAIRAMADAISRRDEPAVAAILQKAGPRLASKLWDADLPRWVAPEKYLDTLKTQPAEMWRVKWNYDFDTPAAAAELGAAVPALKGPLGVLTQVRKAFPEGDQPRRAQLQGATTFGYDPKVPGSGSVTPNVIRMTTTKNGRTGAQDPVALMTYSEKPWFDRKSGVGFNDEFKALTPNIILAKGRVAEYTDADLHGSAAAPRPLVSRLLGQWAGGERVGVQPQVVRFWMQRARLDANETPVGSR